LTKLLLYLRDRTGNDFSLYKDTTTLRRIERRMNIHQIDTLAHYLRYVQSDASEAQALFQELLIGVTSFFRDPQVFEFLDAQGLPQLLDHKPDGYTVRAWVPACSTGEEAYSVAMALQEYIIRHKRRFTIQVFGTDIDAEAIGKARLGMYPEGIARHVSASRLERFFVKEDSHYRVRGAIRERITFATHNVLKDPPFTKVDLLTCRNLLIYLRPETQQWLIPLFHYALKPQGLLMLGNAETIDGFATLFAPVNRQARIYARNPGPIALPPTDKRLFNVGTAVERSTASPPPAVHRASYLVESIHTVLLDRFAPPGVFVNRHGHVVYIHGRTGDYLEPASGPASQQVADMARPGLRRELISALQLAEKQGGTVVRKGVRVQTNEETIRVTLTVTPLYKPDVLQGLLLVSFETESGRSSARPAVSRPPKASEEERSVTLELEYTQQRLQRANEELQLSNEEFKSANEEFQSTNEELQSTNEELETTKEELQSLNEELVTVNAQLQSKLDELSTTNDDLQNLINSTDVATVFLDSDLRIKRFTPEAASVSKVIASDIGRPFSDIVTKLRYDGLIDDARSVLQTLVIKEREVEALDGRWYLLRLVPYRTTTDLIDGVVLTFVDITASKRAGQQTRQAQLYAESIVDTVRGPLLILDTDLRVVTANRSFYRAFESDPAEIERHPLDRILGGRLNQPALRTALDKVAAEEPLLEDIELSLQGSKGGRWMANARRFQPMPDHAPLVLLALERLASEQSQ